MPDLRLSGRCAYVGNQPNLPLAGSQRWNEYQFLRSDKRLPCKACQSVVGKFGRKNLVGRNRTLCRAFNGTSSFYRIFKEKNNLTPGKYRTICASQKKKQCRKKHRYLIHKPKRQRLMPAWHTYLCCASYVFVPNAVFPFGAIFSSALKHVIKNRQNDRSWKHHLLFRSK